MKDLPVILDQYRLTVTEAPTLKLREQDGRTVEATARDGAQLFIVGLFAKLRDPGPGGRRAKGEEIKVTLESDPGEGFDEGAQVALINPRVSPYAIEGPYGTNAGISFRALGMTPAPTQPTGRPRPAAGQAAQGAEEKGEQG